MRTWFLLALLASCYSTRQLADPADPRLRTPGHGDGFVVPTTERWHERITPSTTLRFAGPTGTWTAPVSASELHVDRDGAWLDETIPLVALVEGGRATRVGWRWDEIRRVEVTNLSGGKTLAGVVGTTAATATIAALVSPLIFLAGGVLPAGGGSSFGRHVDSTAAILPPGGHEPRAAASWEPELAGPDNLAARSLFTSGARVRAIALPVLVLDGAASVRGDLVTSGALARVRLADIFELGLGGRSAETRAMTGWKRSSTVVFQSGLHLPIDAGERVAVPLGFEISGGGEVHLDLRFPWGVQGRWGRWLATVSPATPAYVRLGDQPHGRWTLVGGGELGMTF